MDRVTLFNGGLPLNVCNGIDTTKSIQFMKKKSYLGPITPPLCIESLTIRSYRDCWALAGAAFSTMIFHDFGTFKKKEYYLLWSRCRPPVGYNCECRIIASYFTKHKSEWVAGLFDINSGDKQVKYIVNSGCNKKGYPEFVEVQHDAVDNDGMGPVMCEFINTVEYDFAKSIS